MSVIKFPTAAERHANDIEQWKKDLKARYRAEYPGSWTACMNDMEDMLFKAGWSIEMQSSDIPEQTAYIDFDKQNVQSRNWKAYMAHMVLDFVLNNIDSGRGLWEITFEDDLNDPQIAQDSVGKDYTWFPQLLKARIMQPDESIPTGPPLVRIELDNTVFNDVKAEVISIKGDK